MINLKDSKKRYSKYAVTIVIASLLISSLLIGAALGFLSGQSTFTNKADYVVLEGVAGNDYYDTMQYSYQVNQWANETFCGIGLYGDTTDNPNPNNAWFNATKSLRIGFTEFGEFASPNNVGIAYGKNAAEFTNTESWASTGIPASLWIQGWTFYMNYSVQTITRQIEAYAVYSNTVTAESGRGVYSWPGTTAFLPGTMDFTPLTGGNLVTGTLTASGVQVLYDSARLVVARSSVLIHDGLWPNAAGGDMDVAKITFTVVYNKDTKYAIVYKDIKMLIPTKLLDQIYTLEFSERYEIDLAYLVNLGNQAYVHFYQNYNQSTYTHPLVGSNQTSVVQAYDPAHQYIFFAGYWPNCTEYSVYAPLVPNLPAGLTRILPKGTAQADMPNEPNTPWVIAQWMYNGTQYPKMLDFLANGVPNREIRFVEVFGMTDYNTGNQAYNTGKWGAHDLQETPSFVYGNTLDTEVRYMLYGKVFVPEDLTQVNTRANGDSAPFQWIALGQSSLTTDSAGALTLADLNQAQLQEPLGLFDKNDSAFPFIGNKGTIPYGLANGGNFISYLETFNNVAKLNSGTSTGADATNYIRTGLVGFAFGYDGTGYTTPQPVAGGYSSNNVGSRYWYPSKDPLTERWAEGFGDEDEPNAVYSNILYHPNGIITVGGEKANGITRYFNDFNFAIAREGTTSYALVNSGVTGAAPTSNPGKDTIDYFPISTWASSVTPTYKNTNDTMGFVVISTARDVNGTRGLSVYGWDARDTYWGAAWASQYLGIYVNNGWIPKGTVSLIISISYTGPNAEPTNFNVIKALGTITEFGSNVFVTNWHGFDTITGIPLGYWNGVVNPPALPNPSNGYKVWWYAKLPTTSTAKVDYDP